MEGIRLLLKQAGEVWRRLGPNQRVSLLGAFLLAVSAAVVLVLWARQPDYALLYSGLKAEEASGVVDRLRADKVPFRLSQGGSAIEVPSSRLYELRLELVSHGVVKPAHLGYEIFDRTNIGMTDFVQKTNYRRALEGELARSIETLDAVQAARVHIVVPEPSLFADEERHPSASIMLTLRPGGGLDRSQVEAVTQFVAGSVEGLRASAVTVTSSDGSLLSLAYDGDEPASLSNRQLEIRQDLENYLTHKAQGLLDSVVGTGHAQIRLSAELDFQQVERSVERYDPESRAIRSEQREAEETTDGTGSREKTVSNYELTKTVERILDSMGEIQRLSVAVIVDGTYTATTGADGKPSTTFVPRGAPELEELGRMVKNAIGFDDKRGDVLEIACIALGGREEEPPASPVSTYVNVATRTAPRVLPLVGFLVLLLLLRRSVNNLSRGSRGVRGKQGAESFPAPEIFQVETEQDRERRALRERVESMARERPEVAAQLIRSWLVEKK